jgi:hypothetical protein
MRSASTPHVEPEAHGLEHLVDHHGVIEVQVGLVRKEAVPVIGLCRLVPRPVGLLCIRENDASVFVNGVALRPDVHVALRGPSGRQARRLEPRMLIAGVVDDQLDHHLHVVLMSRVQEKLEIVQGPIGRIDVDVVGDIVAVVAQRRGEKGQQPDACDTQILQVIQPRKQPWEVADAVAV